jgi:hypothetical protein
MSIPKDPINAELYKQRIREAMIEYSKHHANPMLGKHHTQATKEKMSARKIGKPRPPFTIEHKSKIGAAHKGKTVSLETREKLRRVNLGKKHSAEVCTKRGLALRGKTRTKEVCAKMSLARIGKKHSEESKQKMRESRKHISPETHANMSEGQRKRLPPTQETRMKMSAGRKGDKNPKWCGGNTPVFKLIRTCVKMSEWRAAVFKRDGYVDCFSGCGGQLEAHHIISFTKLLKQFNIKTVDDAMNCEALWDIDNGTTMLKTTHKAYHNLWGK